MSLTKKSANAKDLRTGLSARLEHRHMAFIAAVLADSHDLANAGVIARRFAAALSSSNPKFDRDRFLRAAGFPD